MSQYPTFSQKKLDVVRVVYNIPKDAYWCLDEDDKAVGGNMGFTRDHFKDHTLWTKVVVGQPKVRASSRSEALEDDPDINFTTHWLFP